MCGWPPPTYGPGQAKLIQPLGIIIRDPARQDMPLPRTCRYFEALKLTQHLEQPALTEHLSSRRYMLPTEQPAHKLRSGHRFNLLAQRCHGKPVNARQQPPFAPFSLTRMRIGEFTSQDGTAGFQAEQCLFNIRRRKSEKISELRCRSWTEMRHPAADRCEKCIVARGGARFDFRQLWFKAGAWKQRSKASYSLGCDPIDATIKPGASGTILPEQSLKVGTPVCKFCVGTAALIGKIYVGTAALGRPVERSSTVYLHERQCRRQFRLSVDELVSRDLSRNWLSQRVLRQRNQRVQHVVQFIGIAHIRPGFLAHLGNRFRIEFPDLLQH